MRKLSERERIEILCMIGFGDKSCTETEVVKLQLTIIGMVSRVKAKFQEFGHVQDIEKSVRKSISTDDELDIVLAVQDNPHTTITNMPTNVNMA